MPLGIFFSEDVPLEEFIYLVFTRMPGGVNVGDSGLCCCVPCLLNAIIPLCLLILWQMDLSSHRQQLRMCLNVIQRTLHLHLKSIMKEFGLQATFNNHYQ